MAVLLVLVVGAGTYLLAKGSPGKTGGRVATGTSTSAPGTSAPVATTAPAASSTSGPTSTTASPGTSTTRAPVTTTTGAPVTSTTGPPTGSTTRSTATTATRGTAPPSGLAVGTATMQVTASTPHGTAAVPVAIYYPAVSSGAGAMPDHAGGPYPLVIFSQGFGEYPSAYAILMEAWAQAGFVVAAPTYTHTDPGPGLYRPDIVDHPAELSATITAVLQDDRSSGGLLSGLVDPSEVAVAGQSDGGDVSLAAAVNTCCRDTRIKAAVILSGAEYSVFGGSYFTDGSPPLLVTQGNDDSAFLGNAPVCSTNLYNAAPAPKYYVDLLGATHLPPYTEANGWERVVARVSTEFLDAYLRHDRAELGRMMQDGNVAGVATITSAPQVPSAGGTC